MYLQGDKIETGVRHVIYSDKLYIHILVTMKGIYKRSSISDYNLSH